MVPGFVVDVREQIIDRLPVGRVVSAHTEKEHYYKDTHDNEVYPSVTTKTSLLSRAYYKQMAADKAVDHIQSFLDDGGDVNSKAFTQACVDARKAHEVDLARAGMWGTQGHDIIDRYMQDWIEREARPTRSIKEYVNSTDSPEAISVALSASKFFDDYTLFPIASERKVISKKHKYAGTLDSLWAVGEVYKKRVGDETCPHVWYDKNKDSVQCGLCHRQEKLQLMLGDWKSSNQIFGFGSMGKFEYAMQVAAYDNALREMTGIKPKRHWIIRLDKQEPKYEIGVVSDVRKSTKMFLYMNEVSDFARSKTPPVSPLIKKDVLYI